MNHKPKYRVIERTCVKYGNKCRIYVLQKLTWLGFYWDTNKYWFKENEAEKHCRKLNIGWIEDIFTQYGFNLGRIISASKSEYRKRHPNNFIMFNVNIFIRSKHKVWYGDLDITKDAENLQKVCDEISEEMIVVSEMKGRFGADERKYKEIRRTADVIFTPNKDYYELLETDGIAFLKSGNMHIAISKPKQWNKINY